ncbi:MAG: acylphosphatase [Burkholderiales bacterium]|jgi:acylphosphatase|nr:acylphosphatase [Burkholderiales bacterium]
MTKPIAKHLIIEGHVQGVAFRANAIAVARKKGISGWIRNLADGTVEILAQGDAGDVDGFVQWCRCGPRFADVTGLIVTDVFPDLSLESFERIRDR